MLNKMELMMENIVHVDKRKHEDIEENIGRWEIYDCDLIIKILSVYLYKIFDKIIKWYIY